MTQGADASAAAEPLLGSYGLEAVRLNDAWANRQLLVACNTDRALSPAVELLWKQLSLRSP